MLVSIIRLWQSEQWAPLILSRVKRNLGIALVLSLGGVALSGVRSLPLCCLVLEFPDRWRVVEHRIQQRLVHNDCPVVVNETCFAKFVHEVADARSRGADHCRERFLTYSNRCDGRTTFFSIIGEKQKEAGEPLLARIEKLIDHVSLDPAVPVQHMVYK